MKDNTCVQVCGDRWWGRFKTRKQNALVMESEVVWVIDNTILLDRPIYLLYLLISILDKEFTRILKTVYGRNVSIKHRYNAYFVLWNFKNISFIIPLATYLAYHKYCFMPQTIHKLYELFYCDAAIFADRNDHINVESYFTKEVDAHLLCM